MKTKYYLYIAVWITIFMTWFLVSGLLAGDAPKPAASVQQQATEIKDVVPVSSATTNADIGYLHLDGNEISVALDRESEPALLAAINERDEVTKENLVTSGKAINVPDGTSVLRLGAAGHSLVHLQIVGGIHGNEEVYAPVDWYKKKSL